MVVRATGRWDEANVSHLQRHGCSSREIIQRFDVKFPPGCSARKEKVARLQNDYERQTGRVWHFTTQQASHRAVAVRESIHHEIGCVQGGCSYGR